MKYLLSLLFVALLGCNPASDKADVDAPATSTAPGANSEKSTSTPLEVVPKYKADTVAIVNNQEISQAEVEIFSANFLSSKTGELQTSEQVLDALIGQHVLMQAAEKELPSTLISEIEKQTERYRIGLYLQNYIRANATPVPIVYEDLLTYYEQNKASFMTPERQKYQRIILENYADVEKEASLKILQDLSKEANLQSAVIQAKTNSNLDLKLSAEEQATPSLSSKQKQIIASLSPGQTSPVYFENGKPAIIRLTETISAQAKPFKIVANKIKKSLLSQRISTELDALIAKKKEAATIEVINRTGALDD